MLVPKPVTMLWAMWNVIGAYMLEPSNENLHVNPDDSLIVTQGLKMLEDLGTSAVTDNSFWHIQ